MMLKKTSRKTRKAYFSYYLLISILKHYKEKEKAMNSEQIHEKNPRISLIFSIYYIIASQTLPLRKEHKRNLFAFQISFVFLGFIFRKT